MNKIISIIKLIRVKHWIKNMLIFLPALFSGMILNKNVLLHSIIGFIIFSFISSCVYVINDISDIEKDKLHLTKKNRPLPSGKIKIKEAYIIFIIMLVLSIATSIILYSKIHNILVIILPVFYLVLNILYSKVLKKIPLIDIGVLSIDYLLRLLYGSVVTMISISNWLYLVVMFASLFMGFGKRRNEIIYEKETRAVLKKYNKDFLDKGMYVSMTLTIVFYSLWCINPVKNKIDYPLFKYSIPIFVLIMFLYSYIIENNNKKSDGDPIEVFFSNKYLLILTVIYVIFMICTLYIKF